MQSCQLNNLRNHKQSGFSLIEMMVVIGIMAIMMAIAIPSFSAWRERSAAKTATDTLVAHLKQARIKAVSGNRQVTVVLTSSGYTIDSTAVTPQVIGLAQYSPNLTLTHGGLATFSFSSRGTSSNKTITIVNASGKDWVVTINEIGRVYSQ